MNMHYTILSTLNYLVVLIRHHKSLKISTSLSKLIWIAHPGSKNEFLHQTKKIKTNVFFALKKTFCQFLIRMTSSFKFVAQWSLSNFIPWPNDKIDSSVKIDWLLNVPIQMKFISKQTIVNSKITVWKWLQWQT